MLEDCHHLEQPVLADLEIAMKKRDLRMLYRSKTIRSLTYCHINLHCFVSSTWYTIWQTSLVPFTLCALAKWACLAWHVRECPPKWIILLMRGWHHQKEPTLLSAISMISWRNLELENAECICTVTIAVGRIKTKWWSGICAGAFCMDYTPTYTVASGTSPGPNTIPGGLSLIQRRSNITGLIVFRNKNKTKIG